MIWLNSLLSWGVSPADATALLRAPVLIWHSMCASKLTQELISFGCRLEHPFLCWLSVRVLSQLPEVNHYPCPMPPSITTASDGDSSLMLNPASHSDSPWLLYFRILDSSLKGSLDLIRNIRVILINWFGILISICKVPAKWHLNGDVDVEMELVGTAGKERMGWTEKAALTSIPYHV